ncbi:uncharacterized protein LOC144826120 [Lissotriton helveticus]
MNHRPTWSTSTLQIKTNPNTILSGTLIYTARSSSPTDYTLLGDLNFHLDNPNDWNTSSLLKNLANADLLESNFLLTRDNHTNLAIRIIPGVVGFTYLTFNKGDTVPITFKSHLYTSAEMRFSSVEKVLTAVQMAILKERALSQGKRMLVVTPCPALEAVTKASVPNSKALHPRWIQWAASLTSPDVTFIFDASLQSQEFLQYEFVHPVPLAMRPLEDFHCIIYTDGSAQVAHGSKHAYISACAIVVGAMVNDEFKSRVVHKQTLGDCTAQLAELRALMLALEYADPSVTTLIVSDSDYCVQSYNENLFFWIQNDFRDSKGSTIKHKMIWVRVAELKEQLPLAFVIHTLGHQREGVHAVGNSLADEAAKSAVSTYLVAAVTRSKSKIDDDILAAVAATEKGSKYPKGFPSKYSYHLSPDKVPYVKIPDVGERLVPNADRRPALITAAHESVATGLKEQLKHDHVVMHTNSSANHERLWVNRDVELQNVLAIVRKAEMSTFSANAIKDETSEGQKEVVSKIKIKEKENTSE